MAHGAPEAKIQATRSYGAEVVQHGKVWDDAYLHSLVLQKEHNLTYIHPFDDPLLVAGQGGVGYETIEDVPGLDMLIVPIGGGGLISGCAQIVKLIKPDIKVSFFFIVQRLGFINRDVVKRLQCYVQLLAVLHHHVMEIG